MMLPPNDPDLPIVCVMQNTCTFQGLREGLVLRG